MKKNYIGIEIGKGSVAMYRSDKKAKVLVSRMPENLIRGEEIVSPELLSQFLKDMKKEGEFKGKLAALVIPEMNTYFRSITMPPITERQLRLNLPYEFRDFVGNESVKYNYDYAVDGYEKDDKGNVTGINLLAAAASKDAIKRYEQILARAGFSLKVAVPREMAIINLIRYAISRGASADSTYCLLDVGHAHTRVYILQGGDLKAAKIIDIGVREIDEVIAEHYNTDVYLAASYREADHENILESEICVRVYDRIALEVMKAINFYKYEHQQSEFDKCYVCGSGSDMDGFIRELLSYIQLDLGNIGDILPEECRGDDEAKRAIAAIGASIQ